MQSIPSCIKLYKYIQKTDIIKTSNIISNGQDFVHYRSGRYGRNDGISDEIRL